MSSLCNKISQITSHPRTIVQNTFCVFPLARSRTQENMEVARAYSGLSQLF